MKKTKRSFALILCFIFSFFIFGTGKYVNAYQERFIRIALYHDVSSLSSSGSKESIQISAVSGLVFGYSLGGTFTELYSTQSGERYTVKSSPDNTWDIMLYNAAEELILTFDTRTGNFQAKPGPGNDPQIIRLGDYYRGILEFRRFPDYDPGDITVINEVNVEDYLYGVVPKEIESYAPYEALKAQAVAARSYAYKYIESPKSPYGKISADLSDSSDSQVYCGYAIVNRVTGTITMVEQASTNSAVNATKGQALKYNGTYIYAFFSSSNGGYTEGSENVWGGSTAYLQANPDPYEVTTSSKYYWERTFTSSDLRNIVLNESKNTKDIGDVIKVEILARADSGRPVNILLTGTNGTYNICNGSCRTAFSLNGQLYDIVNNGSLKTTSVISGYGNTISSADPAGLYVINSSGIVLPAPRNSIINGAAVFRTFENVSSVSDSFTFIGRGWGHGVGMSQDGAKGMAARGYTYRQILSFYYPGTTIN
jgi:stage II sporulation protein D